MANEIKSDKLYIKDIFARWYRIPEYQRPYVWGKDQVNDLLDDISFAQQNDDKAEYFLGSIVFQTKKTENEDYQEDDLLDGQQRMTTLFLITAIIRDITENKKLKSICNEIIFQDENEFDGTPERIRIIFDIREEVKEFVDKFIKKDSGLNDIDALKQELKNTKDLSIKNMINVIFEIQNYFKRTDTISVENFFKYLNNRVLMIYVSSSSLEDAFKLFTVMNDRGIKLRNSDILKAENLHLVSSTNREKYAKEWEEIENYFEEDFDVFLSHLRTILVKEKARKNLLDEFEENIYFAKGNKKGTAPLLAKGEDTFKYIKKYKKHFDEIFSQDHFDIFGDYKFDNLITIMKNVLPADLWIAPLLRYYDKFGENNLVAFLEKLDNKFSNDWIIGLTPTSRIENMNNIIKVIDSTDTTEDILKNEIFKINQNDFMNVLSDNIYGRRFARYVLYKLDYLYGNSDKINVPSIITAEHILPQTPKDDSQWKIDFTDAEREEWTHKIGNLALISRRKNSSQGRKDYEDKKTKYFKNNIELFRNSLRVFNTNAKWTPSEIRANQQEVLEKIKQHYC
jgi:uncharacterized protein with ParB-like and HNH nuclease domain